MTEKEFRKKFKAERPELFIGVVDLAVSLAVEAGAKFERGMVELPELAMAATSTHGYIIDKRSNGQLSIEHANEVLRRCKAVEGALALLAKVKTPGVDDYLGPRGIRDLRAILEGVE